MSAESIHLFAEESTAAHVTTITHCSEFVRVTIAQPLSGEAIYARAVRQREGRSSSWGYAARLARAIEDAASVLDSASLVSWLSDCGFSATH